MTVERWPNSARKRWLADTAVARFKALPNGPRKPRPAPLPFEQRLRRHRARAIWAEIKPIIDGWLQARDDFALECLHDLQECVQRQVFSIPDSALVPPPSKPIPPETENVPF